MQNIDSETHSTMSRAALDDQLTLDILRQPKHRCHARDCNVEVNPRLLMCLHHWRMVPYALKREVWRYYRPGQEIDKQPSEEYLAAAKCAIEAVARIEGK